MSSPSPRTDDQTIAPARGPLIDLAAFDLAAVAATRDDIALWIPHRHEMALLDAIIWHDEDFSRGIARWHLSPDAFWVRGHFPERAMLPGVLQVEAAAQLSAYLYNRYSGSRATAAFLRIENAVFRRTVDPGQTFYLLSVGQKRSARRFICDVQGIVEGQIAFEAVIHGMRLNGRTDSGAAAQMAR